MRFNSIPPWSGENGSQRQRTLDRHTRLSAGRRRSGRCWRWGDHLAVWPVPSPPPRGGGGGGGTTAARPGQSPALAAPAPGWRRLESLSLPCPGPGKELALTPARRVSPTWHRCPEQRDSQQHSAAQRPILSWRAQVVLPLRKWGGASLTISKREHSTFQHRYCFS